MLLPEDDRPFCLFLDELPASPPDVQKAFYSLLLERRLGEYRLPRNSWVVAAGNRVEDQALTRSLSSALDQPHLRGADPRRCGRLVGLGGAVRGACRGSRLHPLRSAGAVPAGAARPGVLLDAAPWALMSRDLDLAEQAGGLNETERRAIVFGRLSPEDAGLFCALAEDGLGDLRPLDDYLRDPELLPKQPTAMWFVVSRLRRAVERGELRPPAAGEDFPGRVNALLGALPQEYRFAVLLDLVQQWDELGASEAMLATLKEVTGL